MANHAGGISIVTFVVAVAVSIGYYQFMYVPQVNAKPILKPEVLNPPEFKEITIAPGSSIESNGRFFEPKFLRVTIGIDNRIIWKNTDEVAHTVTSDDGYTDLINGKFDSLATIGLLDKDGGTYEFTFTKVGTYAYHCEPHPFMQGEIEVIENFA